MKGAARATLALMALGACAPSGGIAARPVIVEPAPVPTASMSAPEIAPDEDRSPPPYTPVAPFSIVARAGGDERLIALPLEGGGEALVVALAAMGAARVPRFARLDKDTIAAAPELATGAPALPPDAGEHLRGAGRLSGELWLAHGKVCVVQEWQPTGWVVRAPHAPVSGSCERLSAWTRAAALAAIEGTQATLTAYGAAPKAIPVPAPGRDKARPDCPTLNANYSYLRAFAGGEVMAIGPGCASPQYWVESWGRGSSRSVVTFSELWNEGPIDARIVSPDEIMIDGIGLVPGSREPDDVRVQLRRRGGRLVASIKASAKNAVEAWMVEARPRLGLLAEDPSDGFVYDSVQLGPEGEVYVSGSLVRHQRPVQAILLRSRAVTQALVLPPG